MSGWWIWIATGHAGVVINEFLPDPAGADGGYEWIELYNDGPAVDLSGWRIEKATSSNFSLEFTFPPGASIAANGYVVVGEEFVAGSTYILAPGDVMAFGNATSNADAVRIVDGSGAIADTVVYGANNDDGFVDDTGNVAWSLAPRPVQGQTLVRRPNGVDTHLSGDDFAVATVATLGGDNDAAGGGCGPGPGVVINEVMSNPPGADAGFEWVELYNPGTQAIDLSGWGIAAGTSSYSTSGAIPVGTFIGPGQFLVVAQSDQVVGWDVVAPGFTLGNASSNADAVQLRDASACPMDTVVYGPDNTDGWLDDLGDLAVPTPTPPEGKTLSRFPDGVDTQNAAADFGVTDPTPGAANLGGGVVPTNCTLAADAVGVVINELIPDPPGADAGQEWVELHRPSGAPVDLSGWVVAAGTSAFSTRGTIPAGTTLQPGQFLVVGQDFIPGVAVVAPGFSLGNAASNADGVQLRDCAGTPVDTVIYGVDNTDGWLDDFGNPASPAPKPGANQTIGRIPDGVDTQDASRDFQVRQPTPGLSNTATPPDCGAIGSGLVINELHSNPAGTDDGFEWVELFHAGLAPIALEGWAVQTATSGASWTPRHTFGPGQVVQPGQFLLVGGLEVPNRTHDLAGTIGNGTNGDGVRVVDCGGFASDTVVYGSNNDDGIVDDSGEIARSVAPTPPENGSIQRVEDGYDTDQSGLDFVIAAQMTPGGPNPRVEPVQCNPSTGVVKINELVPDPAGADAGKEWVELYNASDAPVRIDGWAISAGTSNYDRLSVILPGGQVIEPGGFFVIGGELVLEANLVAAFSLGNGTSNPDGVRLFDCEGATVDTVVYGAVPAPDFEPDGIVDDNDLWVEPYGQPRSDQAIHRVLDGVDTDTADDWKVGRPTPGASNEVEYSGGGAEPLGCGCGQGAPDNAPPGGGAPGGNPPSKMGCATAPSPLRVGALTLLALWCVRRRRAR